MARERGDNITCCSSKNSQTQQQQQIIITRTVKNWAPVTCSSHALQNKSSATKQIELFEIKDNLVRVPALIRHEKKQYGSPFKNKEMKKNVFVFMHQVFGINSHKPYQKMVVILPVKDGHF